MEASLSTGLLLGLLLGMRHALEPDHLAAVSTLVMQRRSARAGAVVGAFWGLGHALALLAVGLMLAALHARLSPAMAAGFELLVAFMLIFLGARAVVRAVRTGTVGPTSAHRHGDKVHVHSGHEDHIHVNAWTLARQPLVVGLIHGLAGSGALTALVMAKMPSAATRVAYMALFGLGALLGMAFLTGLAGWPLTRFGRDGRLARWLSAATGAFSLVLGAWWGWPLAGGLLRL